MTDEDLHNLGKYFQMPFRDFKTTYVNVQQTPNPVKKNTFHLLGTKKAFNIDLLNLFGLASQIFELLLYVDILLLS